MPLEPIKTYTSHEKWITGPTFAREKKLTVNVKIMARCTRCKQIFPDLEDRDSVIYHECVKAR